MITVCIPTLICYDKLKKCIEELMKQNVLKKTKKKLKDFLPLAFTPANMK